MSLKSGLAIHWIVKHESMPSLQNRDFIRHKLWDYLSLSWLFGTNIICSNILRYKKGLPLLASPVIIVSKD